MANQRAAKPDATPPKDGVTLYEAQRRRTLAQAQQEELKAKTLEGTLVPVVDVADTWQQAASSIRAKLLALPTKAAPLCMGVRSVAEIRSVLETIIREALDELSNLRLQPVHPAAEPDGERVGRRRTKAQS